ncbi:unnamed protein product [Natator depressus]
MDREESTPAEKENMDFPKLVLDDKILMDILVLALMLIAIGIAFLIYHRKENIERSKLLLAQIILLTTAVISLFALIIIGTIFLTYRCSGHLDMPKLVLFFSILLAVATVSLFILIPFLIYYHCCLGDAIMARKVMHSTAYLTLEVSQETKKTEREDNL